jgi:S-formylglutathione hydrolase FrmB
MGGHGAINFYLKYNKHFRAAGSMSGILDITQFSTKWGINKKFGDYKKNKKYWEKNSSIYLLKSFTGNKKNLKMFISCGDKDFANKVNKSFGAEAKKLKIPILNVTDSGDHNWDYWTSHIDSQMLFFYLVSHDLNMGVIQKIMKLR